MDRRHPQFTAPRFTRRQRFSVLEILIAAVCGLIVVAAGVSALTVTAAGSQMAAQHTSAMCLCQERLEQIRAEGTFANVDATHYPNETALSLTHAESPVAVIVSCNRLVEITDASRTGMPGKRVVVRVQWTFRGRANEERIEGIVYDSD